MNTQYSKKQPGKPAIFGIWYLVFGVWLAIGVSPLPAQDSSKEEEALYVARKAFDDGFYDVSLSLLDRFLKNYPDSQKKAEANLLAGQCYFHQNKFLEALDKLQELLNQNSAKDIKDSVLYWIAEVHFKGNDFIKAGQYYKRVVDEFPKSAYLPASLYSLGWCLFQEGNFSEALNFFKIVEEKFPLEPQSRDSSFKIIECLYNLKDYGGLKEKLKNYLKSYPKDTGHAAYLYFYLAEAEYYLNDFSEASGDYAKVIASTADDKIKALAKLGMAWSYLKIKDYPEAEKSFLEVKPDILEKRSRDILLLGKAILMSQTNRFAEARNAYNELLNATDDPVVLIQSYMGEADALYNMAEYKEAVVIYKKALDGPAKDSVPGEIIDKLHYGLAWAFLKEGQFKEAIEEFQKIAKHTEDKIIKISALCQIGDTYQDVGDYEKAIHSYDSILKDYPDSFYSDYVQYQLGLCLLRTSNYEGAIMSFLNLKRNFPDSKLLDDASYALGLSYFQRQDYVSSREIFEKFIEEFKDSNLRPQGIYLLGTSLYNLGKFSEAIEAFKNILRLYGQDVELVQKAEYEIADCFFQMGNELEAVSRFKALRAKYPDSRLTPEVIWWLGEYYYRHNDLALARRYFSSLIQDFSKSNLITDAYYALGSISTDEAKYEEAIGNFNKIISSGKSDLAGQAGVAIADIYSKEEKFDLALKAYKEVSGQYANLASLVYPRMADILYKIGSYAEAIELYRKSIDMVSVKEMSLIQFKIAESQQAQGKVKEAIEEYLKVTYLYSEDQVLATKSLLRIAAIYEDKENFKEAANIYKRIVSMEAPEAKYAKERLDWIKIHIR